MKMAADDENILDFGAIFAVADGIGGEHGGETASRLTLFQFERHFYHIHKKGADDESYVQSIRAAAGRANETILALAASNRHLKKMGTTLAGVCLTPPGYILFHAGDSRIYRFRNGILKQLTRDDTLAEMAYGAGILSSSEIFGSYSRHTLTNFVGSETFALHINPGPKLNPKDIILICSDGLHGEISLETLERALGQSSCVKTACDKLLHQYYRVGGTDNISVILIQALDSDLKPPDILNERLMSDESCIQ